jgi:hypothetical protein
MINAPTKHHVRFTIFATGKVVGTDVIPFGMDWDEIERRAERIAREWDAEIDISTSMVFPSGKIAGWERAGIRVRPS